MVAHLNVDTDLSINSNQYKGVTNHTCSISVVTCFEVQLIGYYLDIFTEHLCLSSVY